MKRTQIKVLLIEDNPADVLLLKESLSSDLLTDFHVTVAEHLKHGLVKLAEESFDVLLLDLGLPDSQGLETFEAAHEQFFNIPIIVLSGMTDDLIALQAVQAGAQDYLVKGETGWTMGPRAIRYAIERHQSQQAKIASEARFSTFFHSSPMAIAIARLRDGLILEVNEAWCQFVGHPQDEVIGREMNSLGVWADPKAQMEFVKLMRRDGKVHEFESQMKMRSGEIRDVLFSAELIEVAGESCILSMALDITERIQNEKIIQEQERFIHATFDSLPEQICVLDENYKIIATNLGWRRFADQNGHPQDDFTGANYLSVCKSTTGGTATYAEQFADGLVAIMQGKTAEFSLEYPCDSAIEKRWFIARIIAFPGAGPRRLVVSHTNITQLKASEEATKASEMRFRAMIEHGLDNISLMAPDGTLLWENPAATHMLGYEYDQFKGHNIFELVHADDMSEVQKQFAGILGKPGSVAHSSFRLKHADGSWCWVEGIGTNLLHEPSVGAVVINYRNVTERKLAEHTLQMRTEDLALINSLNEAANRGETIDGLISLFAENIKTMIPSYRGASIYLFDRARKNLELRGLTISPSLIGKIEKLIGRSIPKLDIPLHQGSYFQKLLENEQGIIISDPETLKQWMAEFTETTFLPPLVRAGFKKFIPQIFTILNIASVITLPLISSGKAIGLLDVSSETLLTEDDLIRIRAISSQVTAVILRKQADDALNESKRLLQTVVDTSPMRIFWKDTESRYLGCNPAFAIDAGKTHPRELIGVNDFELIWKSQAELYRSEDQEIMNSGIPKIAREEIQVKPDGQLMWIRSFIVPLRNNEKQVIGVLGVYEDITERKQSEQALQQSHEMLAKLTAQVPGVVYQYRLYSDGRSTFPFASPGMNDIYEVTPEDVQEDATLVFGRLHPEDANRVTEGINESALTLKPFHCEFRVLLPRQGLRWRLSDAMPERTEDGGTLWYGIISDITERKQAEAALQESQRHYRALFEDSPIAIWEEDFSQVKKYIDALKQKGVTDFQNYFTQYPEERTRCNRMIKVLDVNSAALKMYRASSKKELIENTQQTICKGEMEHDKEDLIAIAEGRTSNTWDGGDERMTGEPIEISLTWSVVPGYEHDFSKVIVTTVDITERKQAEELILQYANELELRVEERTTELVHASRAKDEFLANMSHELRTPLNGILGFSETLLEGIRGPLTERQAQAVDIIQSSGQHLLGLINDILDVSKIESGKFELQPETLVVNDICNSSLNFVKQLANKKSITVEYSSNPASSTLVADPKRLKQILVNLLNNAVKFTPEKGNVKLEVRANVGAGFMRFSVTDTGIGIATDDQKKLFKPFIQVDSSLSRQYEGTGLGLSLVKKLVEMHGGAIELTSEIGNGSCFAFTLPWKPTAKDPGPQILSKLESNENKTAAASSPLNTKKILIVDDNKSNVTMVSDYLESCNYQVRIAFDGSEALKEAFEFLPDIILMDIQMPHMSGFEATRRLRSDLRFGTVPIIALTALAMPGDRERCIEAGMDDYLSKPIKLKELSQMIEKFMEQASSK